MGRVLVLGATGDQGHPLITRLLEAGLTPVAALRNPHALQGTEFAHVEVVETDLFNEQSVIAAAEGVDAMPRICPLFSISRRRPPRAPYSGSDCSTER